jgi:hypothetical protein
MSRPIIAATVLAAAALLGACASKNAKESDIKNVLVDAGATTKQADCAASKIFDKLSQDEVNDLAAADHAKDIPKDIDKQITPILDQCLGTGSGSEDPDATTSTTAGEGTTTTVATTGSTEATTSTTAG